MSLTQKLKDVFGLNSIYKQLPIMASLTPKLSIRLEALTKMDTFR